MGNENPEKLPLRRFSLRFSGMEIHAQSHSPAEVPPARPFRLLSLDALRGFDMFWIVGAEGLVEGLRKTSDNGLLRGLACNWDTFAGRGSISRI